VAHKQLWYGDNLGVLRNHIATGSVDLVYLDPPFNSNRSYNVLFKSKSGADAMAQIEAFDDTWTWSHESEDQYRELVAGGVAPAKVSDALEALRKLLGDNDVLAYLVMMTARLVELHRVLKPTGSLYLHCDPVASHYLKVVLDSVFGLDRFLHEIVWQRTGAKGSSMGRLPSNHDVLLAYGKSSAATWHEIILPYDPADLDPKTAQKYSLMDEDGRRYQLTSLLHPEQGQRPNLEYELMGITRTWRWSRDRMVQAVEQGLVVQTAPGRVPRQKRYLDEQKGRLLGDVWADIPPLNSQAAERLGYPTQKPLALMERIIAAASNEGDVVLDPFCGCGTTIDAAQKLHRRWIGIDITYLSVDLIRKRLRSTFGDEIEAAYEVHGIPHDVGGAEAMFESNPFEFERWAVSLIDGQPNEKQVGDKGVDGVVRFAIDKDMTAGRVVVSVKGGKQLNPSMVRDLRGTVESQNAEMGALITLREPTRGMKDEARKSGSFVSPISGRSYPRIQIVTVTELFAGKAVDMPTPFLPYIKAPTFAGYQLSLDEA